MFFYLIGIGYKSSSIEVREAVYRKRDKIGAFWAKANAKKAAMLATCNRFEIYRVARDAIEARRETARFEALFREFSEYGYNVWGKSEVFRHLVRMASGLEPQIKGEIEISRQLGAWPDKAALERALADIVYDALLASHDIRAKSGLNGAENNVAILIFDDLFAQTYRNRPLEIVVAGTCGITRNTFEGGCVYKRYS